MHKNNINLLRLLAACQVVVSHMIGHFGLAPSDSLLVVAIRMFPGVPIFFLLSGYLIFKAWDRDPNIWTYWTNRALRIFPALWAAFGVTIVVLFLSGQFDGSRRETLLWVAAQVTVFQFYNPGFLRDFGVGVMNGALWSIPVEIEFYFVLPILAPLFRRWLVAVLVASTVIIGFFRYESETFVSKLFGVSVVPYLAMFFFGILFACFKRLMSLTQTVSPLVFLAIYVALYFTTAVLFGYNHSGRTLSPLAAPVLAVLVFSLAFGKKFDFGYFDRNDISYGVYLYHMIFINLAIYLGLIGMTGIVFVAMCTALAATTSWLLIEKTSLSLKRHTTKSSGKSALTGTTTEFQ